MKLQLSCSAVVIATILLQPNPSLTQERTTGNADSMLQGCGYMAIEEGQRSPQQWTDALTCVAYARGIVEGYTVANAQLASKHRKLCVPDAVTSGQEALVISKYLQEHPEELHQPDALLVVSAMQRAFPCTK